MMVTILYTDASTKNGYSCYAYKYSGSKSYVGMVRSMNTAATETLAVIRGLSRLPDNTEVLVISDFMGVVTNIINYRQGIIHPCMENTQRLYRTTRNKLFKQLDRLDVDAIWVASRFPNETHLEVDSLSRSILQEYLKRK